MTTITARILAGEIVLTKTSDGTLAASALAEKFWTTLILSGEPVIRKTVTATKKSGETVDLTVVAVIGTATVDGQEIMKVAVAEKPRPVYARPARCTHIETDTHGICYQCGAYDRSGDAGRFI